MLDRSALAAFALACSLWAGAGCEGCRDRAAAPPAKPASTTPTAAPTRVAQNPIEARLAKRSLARDKSYPRGEDGSVQCARDADCFIVQAEQCNPALLEHTHSATGFGLEQRASSTFRITGKGDAGCKLERHVTELRVRMAARVEQLLLQQGKTAADVQQIRDRMLRKLRERNRPGLACELAREQLLALALDLAEGRFDPTSLAGCTALDAPEPAQLSELGREPEKPASRAAPPEPNPREKRKARAGAAE